MTGTSSSSSSSCTSFGSFDDVSVSVKLAGSIKFLCSYGGKILPCHPDGRLRYVGGHTRVLAVRRSISFSELQVKLRELCGWSAVSLRCQLPTEDMDALVSVTSDEDLANLIEEYDVVSRDRPSPRKIRAFLSTSSRSSTKTSPTTCSPTTPISAAVEFSTAQPPTAAAECCVHQISVPVKFLPAAAGDHRFHGHHHHHHHHGHGTPRACNYLVHHGSHWN